MAAPADIDTLIARIRDEAAALGFTRFGISGVALGDDESHLRNWLQAGMHGTMQWMAAHGDKRSRPDELIPGTVSVISVGLDYGREHEEAWATLADGERAYVARYALGRDYHKLMRQRLQTLAERIEAIVGQMSMHRRHVPQWSMAGVATGRARST